MNIKEVAKNLILLVLGGKKVAVAHVKSMQVVTRIFGIKDIFVDDKCGSSCFWSITRADLANGSIFAKYVIHVFTRNFVGKVFDEQDTIDFRRKTCLQKNYHDY